MSLRIGYACINTELRGYDVFTSRGLILATVASKGMEYIHELIRKNVDDLMKILIFNEAHGIRFYRISSCVFPHLGNPAIGTDYNYNLDFIRPQLKLIGSYALAHGHRLTMHPGQFVQLGSPDKEIVRRSIDDLSNHARLLKMLGYKPENGSVLIIHGGGTYGDRTQTLMRWRENFLNMPIEIRNLIALENDENAYGIMDLLPICEELMIPFCLDIFHNRVSKRRVAITVTLMERIKATWTRNKPPKIHVSEQQPNLRRGAHSATLNELPLYVLRLPTILKTDIDIMLEVKDKEVSVLKMYYKYFTVHQDEQGRIDYKLKPEFTRKNLTIDE